MPRPVHGNHRYVPALDGLRALAVLLVIAYHLDVPGFDGGLLGVGVFFTLSGYLITLGLMSSKLRDGTFNLKTFWFRRFRRLMPAMLATVFAVVLLSAAFDTANFRTRFGEALSSVFYVNNWHNIFTGTSYFERFQGPGPLDHMWSLSIEEQFYLIWPLLLWVLVKVCRRPWLIATVTGVIALLSYLQMWAMAEPGVDFTRVYEGTDTRAGGLLIGAVLAIVVAARQHEGKTAHLPPIGASLLGAAGVAGIVALSMAVGEQDIFLYRGGMLLLNLATAAAILAVLTPGGPWAAIFGFEPLRWIGERSYGIYLWHMPIIYFMPDEWLRDAPLKSALVVLILSVAVASLSWSIFEDPIRRHGVILSLIHI